MSAGTVYTAGERSTKHYADYATAKLAAVALERSVWIQVRAGEKWRRLELPAEPFTLQEREGDLVHIHYALHGQLHPGDGRGRGSRPGLLDDSAPWIVVNAAIGHVDIVRPPARTAA